MKKKLVIWTNNNSYEQWSAKSYDTGLTEKQGGIGGSESWVIEMCTRFADAGYEVHIFNNCPDDHVDHRHPDVHWHVYRKFEEWIKDKTADICVHFRDVSLLHKTHIMDKIKDHYVLAEDTVLTPDQNHPVWLPEYKKYIRAYIPICPYHKKFLAAFHKIPEEMQWIGKNGVDLELYDRAKKEVEKVPNSFFYSSSLDRGIDNLLQFIWPSIKKRLPDATLHVAYGFNNWEKSIAYPSEIAEKPQTTDIHIKWIKRLIKAGEEGWGVKFHGRLNKYSLAKMQSSCIAHIYPTFFSETFCSTYLEAMAADAVTISTNIWGGRRTGKAGVMLDCKESENPLLNFYLDAYNSDYQIRFRDAVVKLATNEKARNNVLERQRSWVKKFTWDKSASEYLELFDGKFHNEKGEISFPGYDID